VSNDRQIFKIGAVLLSSAVTYNTCIVEASLDPAARERDYYAQLYNIYLSMGSGEVQDAFRRFCNGREESAELLAEWLLGEGAQYGDLFGIAPQEAAPMEEAEPRSEMLARSFRWFREEGLDLSEIQARTQDARKVIEQNKKNLSEQGRRSLMAAALPTLEWGLVEQHAFGKDTGLLLSQSEREMGRTAGLANPKSTCFLNAALQLLVRLSPFIDAIEQYTGNDIFIWVLKFLFRAMRILKTLDLDYMNYVLRILQLFMPGFDLNRQQDVEEFLTILFARIERAFPPREGPTECFRFELEEEIFTNRSTGEKSVLSRVKKSDLILALPFPEHGEFFTLGDLLDACFAESGVIYNETDVLSKESVTEWPDHLLIQIVRFQYKEGRVSKIDTPVGIPTELDLNAYSYENSSEKLAKFKLRGIIYHAGTIENGHYVFEEIKRGSEREIYNDENVNGSLPPGMTPYILWYERIKKM
jgi:uncharacterized UBP type Zn finger protein